MTITAIESQKIAQVDLYFGAKTYIKLDVYALNQGGRWLASDVRCRNGDASTSIFADTPPACIVKG